jgi:uncharacterized damage-inducible protein DinB
MAIADAMVSEFEHEAATTRRVLARVPDEKFDWVPHEKSFSMGALASHVVNLLGWAEPTFELDEFEIPADYKPWNASSKQQLLEQFDANVAEVKEKLAGYPDDKMMQPWTLKGEGRVYFSMPRVAVVRSFILNHLVHHRGQLSVYLRLNDIPVPSIYGPSADES